MTLHTSQPASSALEGPGAPSNQKHDVMMEPVQFVSGSDDDLSDEDELLNEADLDITATSERSSSWATLSYTHLKKIVAKAKGAATKPVVRFIKKHLGGTKLIFVVGQSGSGKSTLLSEICGQDLGIEIGDSHKSGTKQYHVCPALLDEEQYLFIDTAGFGAADMGSMDVFQDIVSCIDALGPFVTVGGLLFVYGGQQTRLTEIDEATIQWVKCFCGPEFYEHMAIVFTQWDWNNEAGLKRMWNTVQGLLGDEPLQGLLNPPATHQQRYHGASVYYHGLRVGDSANGSLQALGKDECAAERALRAQQMVKERFSSPHPARLQICREMANKIPWHKTEAAKVLFHRPSQLRVDIKDGFNRVTILSEEAKAKAKHSQNSQETEGERKKEPKPSASAYKPQKSWSESFFEWLDVATKAAKFFWENRSKRGSRNAKPGEKSTTWGDTWKTVQNWWSGTPNRGTA